MVQTILSRQETVHPPGTSNPKGPHTEVIWNLGPDWPVFTVSVYKDNDGNTRGSSVPLLFRPAKCTLWTYGDGSMRATVTGPVVRSGTRRAGSEHTEKGETALNIADWCHSAWLNMMLDWQESVANNAQ